MAWMERQPAVAVIKAAFTKKLSDSIDGGFERESLPSGMTVAGSWQVADPAQADFAISHSVAYQASSSAEISDSSTGTPGQFAFLYTVPVHLRPHGLDVVGVGVGVRNGHLRHRADRPPVAGQRGALRGTSRVGFAAPPGDSLWTHLTVKARVPGNAAAVLVLLETKDDQGTAWFDSVNVQPDGDNDVTT